MSEPASPNRIRSFHAHVYFRDAGERARALQLRSWIDQRFSAQLGRVHDVMVGPHLSPMYQIAFARDVFEHLMPWLMLNHAQLSVLVHPNTGRALDDHVVHGLWLGKQLGVKSDVLSNDPESDVISPVEPNTKPTIE